MKFSKWFAFISEGDSEERMRAEYQQLPIKFLAGIDTSSLTPLGLKVYREEIARRQQMTLVPPPQRTLDLND